MFVKICGITGEDDARAAIDAGARALGFIFYPPSPRHLDPSAANWIGKLPADIWKVGVFVNQSAESIEQTMRRLALDVAQLHGAETPADAPPGRRVWKAFRVGSGYSASALESFPAEAVLLDGPASGVPFDWAHVTRPRHNLIVAGGLHAGNVRQAIEQTRPWGVDASSSLESAPGRKDHAKVAQFIKAALAS